MGRLYLVADGGEIARRRPLVAAGRLVEAWPDLHTKGEFWMGEGAKTLLDAAGEPLQAKLDLDPASVPVYYGPRLCDVESLPAEESLQTRALSARGIAVAPVDPVFYLRLPGGKAAHVWRLFQSRQEAVVYMAEYFGNDPEGRQWAEGLAAATWVEMIERYAAHQ